MLRGDVNRRGVLHCDEPARVLSSNVTSCDRKGNISSGMAYVFVRVTYVKGNIRPTPIIYTVRNPKSQIRVYYTYSNTVHIIRTRIRTRIPTQIRPMHRYRRQTRPRRTFCGTIVTPVAVPPPARCSMEIDLLVRPGLPRLRRAGGLSHGADFPAASWSAVERRPRVQLQGPRGRRLRHR